MIDEVTIDFGAQTVTGWTSYELASDFLTPADSWTVTLPLSGSAQARRDLRQLIRTDSGLRCFVYIQRSDSTDRAQQLSGIVDNVSTEGSIEGATLRVRGRDNGGLLASASADPSVVIDEDTGLLDAIRTMVEPFGIEVVGEGVPSRTLLTGARVSGTRAGLMRTAARDRGVARSSARADMVFDGSGTDGDERPGSAAARARARRGHGSGLSGQDVEAVRVADAKPDVGETVWDWIDRHARRFGVMPWIGADGRLVVSAPNYDQEPLFSLARYLGDDRRNNIVSGGLEESLEAQSSVVTVYGRTGGHDATRSAHVGRAERSPALMPLHRPLTIHDPSARSDEEALRRAQRELARQNEQAAALEYEVYGHGQGPHLYAVDTVVDVVDEEIGVEGLYWLAGRTFRGDRERGRRSVLKLLPLRSIVL